MTAMSPVALLVVAAESLHEFAWAVPILKAHGYLSEPIKPIHGRIGKMLGMTARQVADSPIEVLEHLAEMCGNND